MRPALCTFEPFRPGVRNLPTLGFLLGRCFDNAFFAGLLLQEPAVKQANGLTVRPCSMSLPGHWSVLDEHMNIIGPNVLSYIHLISDSKKVEMYDDYVQFQCE